MLKIKNLSKTYKNKQEKALDNVSLDVSRGEIFGLVGPNGAGKSTLIKSIVGILKIDEGEVSLDNIYLSKDATSFKAEIGYVSDNHTVMERLTGREYLHFISNIYKVNPEESKALISELTEKFSLQGALDDVINTYSHGMKQKLCIIATLIHKPKVWILDEPLSGLDPQSAYDLKMMMKDYAKQGNIVIFSTHVLEVVEKVCDRVAILNKGKLIELDTIDNIMAKYGKFDTLEDAFISITKKV